MELKNTKKCHFCREWLDESTTTISHTVSSNNTIFFVASIYKHGGKEISIFYGFKKRSICNP